LASSTLFSFLGLLAFVCFLAVPALVALALSVVSDFTLLGLPRLAGDALLVLVDFTGELPFDLLVFTLFGVFCFCSFSAFFFGSLLLLPFYFTYFDGDGLLEGDLDFLLAILLLLRTGSEVFLSFTFFVFLPGSWAFLIRISADEKKLSSTKGS
jgi:hypothetical protein